MIGIFPEEENDEGLRSAPEEANDEDLRRSKIRPKIQNTGTDVYWLVMYFDRKSYKSGKQFFAKKQESKYETYPFTKA